MYLTSNGSVLYNTTNSIIEKLVKNLPTVGNGSEEIRSWIIAHAAMNGEGFKLIDYAPISEVYVGCGWAEWKVA